MYNLLFIYLLSLSFFGINITGYSVSLIEGYIYSYYKLLFKYSFNFLSSAGNKAYISSFSSNFSSIKLIAWFYGWYTDKAFFSGGFSNIPRYCSNSDSICYCISVLCILVLSHLYLLNLICCVIQSITGLCFLSHS